jgi:hypothetical protein
MTTVLDLPLVTMCTVTRCSYNHDGCHAGAITVGTHGDSANCATFIALGAKGGLSSIVAHVGACLRVDCTHNSTLVCTAEEVHIGTLGDPANCLTYSTR